MKSRPRTVLSLFLSLILALGTLPAPALAQMAEDAMGAEPVVADSGAATTAEPAIAPQAAAGEMGEEAVATDVTPDATTESRTVEDAPEDVADGQGQTLSTQAIASGTWGTCPWTISDTGVLTIRPGTGAEQPDQAPSVSVPYDLRSPWHDYRDKVTSVKCVAENGAKIVLPQCSAGLFKSLWSVRSIDLSGCDTSQVTDMSYMFYTTSKLASITFGSTWNTSKVTDLSHMFEDCTLLASLDLVGWNTSRVTDMTQTFARCSSLTSLDFTGWNTSSVTSMYYMCVGCSQLSSITFGSGWNTSQVTNMTGMFDNCDSLTSLDVSDWDTSKVTEMSYTFAGCTSLASIDPSDWNTSKLESAMGTFQHCWELTSLDLSRWDTSKLKSAAWIFADCTSLSSLDLSGWDTSQLTSSISEFFSGVSFGAGTCTSLSSFKVGPGYVIKDAGMFPDATAANGMWWSDRDAAWYTKDQIVSFRSGVADMYRNSSQSSQGKDISFCAMTLSPSSYTFDGTQKNPTITVRDGSATLVEGTHYDVTTVPAGRTDAGTYTYVVTGKGDYAGTKSASFTISPKSLSACTMTLSPSSYTFDGTQKNPTITVRDGSTTLVEGTHYDVTTVPAGRTDAGTYTYVVTGKGNYAGTKSASFTIAPRQKTGFEWGSDNWNFLNSSDYFKGDYYIEQINGTYLKKLRSSLTNTEYSRVFSQSWYRPGYIYYAWQGSCYGMSVTALLAKEGLLPYASYGAGATKLYQLACPAESSDVSSLITYYHMLQMKDVIQQKFDTVSLRGAQQNVQEIISLLNDHSTVVIGFHTGGPDGHAILAYGCEYGSWTWDGVTYGGRIRICDPNASTGMDESLDVYFDTGTYDWCIPGYGVRSSLGAKIIFIGASIAELNQGGYLSGGTGSYSGNYVARIDALAISSSRSVKKVVQSSPGPHIEYDDDPSGGDDIEESYTYLLNGRGEGVLGYNLYDADSAYRVSQRDPEALQLVMSYENCLMGVASDAGQSAVFDKDGYVEVNGDSAGYSMEMTLNEGNPTDWFTVAVSGEGADRASLEKVEGGYVLSGDELRNVTVEANNREVSARAAFTTDLNKAYIYEIDENTIGVSVDADGNGSYETVIADGSTAGASHGATVEGALEAIYAIPDTVWLPDADKVSAARAAYDSLTAEQRAAVPEAALRRLTDAEARIAWLGKADQVITASDKTVPVGGAVSLAAVTSGDGRLGYESANPSVARVDERGVVTGVSVGRTEVTITASETAGCKQASRVVTVTVTAATQTWYDGVDWSPVYDPAYYAEQNPDVADWARRAGGSYGDNLLRHFVCNGAKEGRRSREDFSLPSYYNANADLRRAFGTDWSRYYRHYCTNGAGEGRAHAGVLQLVAPLASRDGVDWSPVYDGNHYAQQNRDVASWASRACGAVTVLDDAALLQHFVGNGAKEGRKSKDGFELASYYNANADLRRAFGTSDWSRYYRHYATNGAREGRLCKGVGTLRGALASRDGVDWSPVYDGAYYAQKNADVARWATRGAGAFGTVVDDYALLQHFVGNGAKEGRRSKDGFELASYYNANADLRRAFGTDWARYYRHYATNGARERRTCSGVGQLRGFATSLGGVDWAPVYDANEYASRNADLASWARRSFSSGSVLDDAALLSHFVNNGQKERRQAKSTFNVTNYRNRYADLNRAFGDNWPSYYRHFATNGYKENRNGA